jgi:putative hydrolase of the HAD superfamily
MFGCTVGRIDLMEALAGVLPRVGYAGNVEDFVRYWFEKDSNINRQVFDLVEKIRQSGARLYVATGQEHHRARYLWNELGFSRWFDRIFYSAEIGHPKSDARFFQAINRELGIDGSMRPLFFDDQPEIVALARSAGWEGAAFNSAGDIRNHPRLRHLWN